MPPVSAISVAASYDPKRRVLALAVLAAVLALDILDGTIVNIAVPSIQRGLGAGSATVQWLVAGYSLAFALLLVTGGRLGDVFGYRRMFTIGVSGFTLASLFCGLAWSPESLIVARTLQGAMAAMMAPQGGALIQVMYRPHERTVVMGVYGAVGGLSAVLGPIIGGALIQANLFGLDWRPIFLVNGPVGVLAVVGGALLLPAGRSSHPMRPDGLGAALIAAALFLIVFPLVQGRDAGWPWWAFAMLIAAAPMLAAFWRYSVWKTGRDGSALLEPGLFRERVFSTGIALNLLFQAAIAGYLFSYTLMLQLGLGYSAMKTSLASAPFAAAVGFSISYISRKAARRLGPRLITLGAAAMGAGMFGLLLTVRAQWDHLQQPWMLIPWLLIAGSGMGMVTGPLAPIVLSNVDVRHAGAASGVLSSIQQLGGTIGVALGGGIFFSLIGAQPRAAPQAQRFAAGFQASLAFEICLLIAVLFLSTRLPRNGRFNRPD